MRRILLEASERSEPSRHGGRNVTKPRARKGGAAADPHAVKARRRGCDGGCRCCESGQPVSRDGSGATIFAAGNARPPKASQNRLKSPPVELVTDIAVAAATATPVARSDHAITPLNSAARLITLERGLYAIGIEPSAGHEADDPTGISVLVTGFPSSGGEPVSLLAASGEGSVWLDRRGGVVVARSPSSGGRVLVNIVAQAALPPVQPRLTVHRLDGPTFAVPSIFPSPLATPPVSRADEPSRDQTPEIPLEVILHIERLGDRVLRGDGWAGNRGSKLRIEGFGVRPLAGLSPRDVHYKVFHPGGIETPWIGGPQLCGSRGQRLPIVGFAVRVAPHLRDRFDVEYQGSFFNSGIANASRNSEPCRPRLAGDPLEAIFVKISERPKT